MCRCLSGRFYRLFSFTLATTVPGWELGLGTSDGMGFKWDRWGVQPKRGSNGPARPIGDNANNGRFEGKAIFVLSVSEKWIYGAQVDH